MTEYSDATLLNGYWFHFEDGADFFSIKYSTLSSQLVISINDEVVFKKYLINIEKSFDLVHNGNNYTVQLKEHKVSTDAKQHIRFLKLACSLSKNDKEIGSQIQSFDPVSKRKMLMVSIPLIALILTLGFIGGYQFTLFLVSLGG